MNGEKEIKKEGETDKRLEQEPTKIYELMEPISQIPDKVLATEEGRIILKALYMEQCYKNRQLEREKSILEEKNEELGKKVVVYEERMGWKDLMAVFSAVSVGIGVTLIQFGYELKWSPLNKIGLILIILGILMIIVRPIKRFLPFRKKGEKEKI